MNTADFKAWSNCATDPIRTATQWSGQSPVVPGCESFDFDADGAIDLHDFSAFTQVLKILPPLGPSKPDRTR